MAKGITYAEKLRDPRWQRKRLEIMQRDGFKCQDCKSGVITLNVHHEEYIKGREPWDYPNSNFRTLCEKCHGKRHAKTVDERPIDNACFLPLKHRINTDAISLRNQMITLQDSLKTIDPDNDALLTETLTAIIKIQKQIKEL